MVIVHKVEQQSFNRESFEKTVNEYFNRDKKPSEDREDKENDQKQFILEYPTVYIIILRTKSRKKFEVYVGETNDITARVTQHYSKKRTAEDWHKRLGARGVDSVVIAIGNEHFNKSLTMDIENELMHYLTSVENIGDIYNRRENKQNKYYTWDKMEKIFDDIWEELENYGGEIKGLFPSKKLVCNSPIFKASPFWKLLPEQYEARNLVLEKIRTVRENISDSRAIMIHGGAGTGKTVLNSSLFYTLNVGEDELWQEKVETYLLVNNEELLKIYSTIAKKLGIKRKGIVSSPTSFINRYKKTGERAEIVLVDEAHLLWMRGNRGYSGKNQFEDLRRAARIVVFMFDEHQITRMSQMWERDMLEAVKDEVKKHDCYIELKKQLRIQAGEETLQWIQEFTEDGKIGRIPQSDESYKIKIFDTPQQLQKAIVKKNEEKVSRLIATYDWPYIDKKKPEDEEEFWVVDIDGWKLPWNKQLGDQDKADRSLSWVERKETINEVGSIYTVAGIDLGYAGVILGPSVSYKDGKIVYLPERCRNRAALESRKTADGKKENYAETFIKNQVNILMTRGVFGLYIYAQDEELRAALNEAASQKINERKGIDRYAGSRTPKDDRKSTEIL